MELGNRRPEQNGTNGHARAKTNGNVSGAMRSSRTNGQIAAPAALDTTNGRLPQSVLSAEELDRFRRVLLAKRAELVGDVTNMENEALGKNRSDAAGDLSQMPIHMADIGTDNYEQEFTLGLIANERATLKEIDAALVRLDDGTYGICLGTHKPISKARLAAKPWAQYCIEYTRSHEDGRKG
jgi:DnaK suppressor protein